jgi:hypothetical protein
MTWYISAPHFTDCLYGEESKLDIVQSKQKGKSFIPTDLFYPDTAGKSLHFVQYL